MVESSVAYYVAVRNRGEPEGSDETYLSKTYPLIKLISPLLHHIPTVPPAWHQLSEYGRVFFVWGQGVHFILKLQQVERVHSIQK